MENEVHSTLRDSKGKLCVEGATEVTSVPPPSQDSVKGEANIGVGVGDDKMGFLDYPESCKVDVNLKDFECPLCCEMFLEPSTIICGHTFCLDCPQRIFDCSTTGQAQCPICRRYIFNVGKPSVNIVLNDFIKKYFPQVTASRLKERSTAIGGGPSSLGGAGAILLPLFILGITIFPKELTRLHVFEPKYRLMVRRSLLTNGKFGILLAGCSVGTEVQIKECTPLPDGRFFLIVVGLKRFRVVETQNVDGYEVARIEDITETTENGLDRLIERVETFMTPDMIMGRQTYFEGLQLPSGSTGGGVGGGREGGTAAAVSPAAAFDFSVSAASLLPISMRQKQRLLEMTSTKLRLETLHDLITKYHSTRNRLSALMLLFCFLGLVAAHLVSSERSSLY